MGIKLVEFYSAAQRWLDFTLELYDKNDNPIIKFNGCYGSSAANLLGRFCHLHNDLQKKVTEHLIKEEQHSSDVIFAEIVHMPEGRPGNIIARPHLRQYEIVFMADSSLTDDFQITIPVVIQDAGI